MKKIILCVLLCITISCLTSCKVTKYKNMKEITYSKILSKDIDTYYVIFHATGCPFCEQLEPTVVKYANYAKKNKDAIPIFHLNLSDKRKNEGINSTIDDEYSSFLGTTNYQDIKFTNAPGLITVSNGQVIKVISSKNTMRPMSEIKELLTSQMEGK